VGRGIGCETQERGGKKKKKVLWGFLEWGPEREKEKMILGGRRTKRPNSSLGLQIAAPLKKGCFFYARRKIGLKNSLVRFPLVKGEKGER